MRIGIAVFDGCFGSGIASLLDIFRTAEGQRTRIDPSIPPIEIEVLAAKPTVQTRSGLTVHATGSFADLASTDVAVITSFGTVTEEDSVRLLASRDGTALVRALSGLKAQTMAAACTGTYALAEAGRLDQRRATTSWWLGTAFHQRYPQVRLDMNSMVVADGSVLTAGPAFAHVDLGLAIVGSVSLALADRVSSLLVLDRRQDQSNYIKIGHLRSNDPLVLDFEQYVRAHLADDFAIAEAAKALGATRRTLERRVRQAVGLTPLEIVQRIRVERARHLLATTELNADQVAAAVGYHNGSTMRALLRRRL